jgi:hypothetical protein
MRMSVRSAGACRNRHEYSLSTPGRDKCGVAVVVALPTGTQNILERSIVARHNLSKVAVGLVEQHAVKLIVLGHATTSSTLQQQLRTVLPEVELITVDETGSTLEARNLFWKEHRPRGWRRLVPLSLQVPPQPVDDFAAVVLAQRFFEMSR